MEFDWDEEKRRSNLEKHGFDFARAIQIFEGRTEQWESFRRDYGEKRFVAVGSLNGRLITVVFTLRGSERRIISARGAKRNERRKYYAVTIEQARNMEDLTDWERVDNMTEEEIEQNALDDPDNPPLTDEELEQFETVYPEQPQNRRDKFVERDWENFMSPER